MAICRRRSNFTKVLLAVPVVWILFMVFFLVDRRDAKPESGAEVSDSRINAIRSARMEINNIIGQGVERPVHAAAGGRESTVMNHGMVQPQQAGQQAELRGFLLPPQEPSGPGEMGKPVVLPANLTDKQKELLDKGWNDNAFNEYISNMISVHRTLPDVRDDKCRERQDWGRLPDTSVVVCFHNEAWSVLVRTVHSILDRSPAHLIREVLLVDDFSDKEHLGAPLNQYMAQYPRVKIVRTTKREGLIRARLLGARHSTGEVITYLDSHCECTEGWLEPLLARIARNRTTVVCPVIDVIDDKTLEYHFQKASSTSVGGFDWNLQFNWHAIPEREKRLHAHPAEPVATPTMAGGLFAIDRRWFETLGTYDPGFDIWGGENLELSFKTWMCGGRLEIVPCSHVGHIFRKRSPYKWRSGVNVLRRNSIRLAEVWMDEYKKYFYERIGPALGDYGDVAPRRALRQRLQCRSFKWYLETIYPELFLPGDAVASGEVRGQAAAAGLCLDSPGRRRDLHRPVGVYPCHGRGGNQIRHDVSSTCLDSACETKDLYKPVGTYPCHLQGGNQYWMLSKAGEIRRDEACLDYAGSEVILYPCHGSKGNQQWEYDATAHLLLHVNSKLCLGLTESRQKLTMEPCSPPRDRIRWIFQHYNATKLV